MAFMLEPKVRTSWTMSEGNVIVSNVIKEMNLVLLEHESCGNGVNGSVTPSFIEEPSFTIKIIEII